MFFQENLQTLNEPGTFDTVEQIVFSVAQWLRLGVEAVGAAVIGFGALLAIYRLVVHFKEQQPTNFNQVRLTLGKYLTLALEFQLGADILSTAIAPTPQAIGKLAAIAAIRTLLNYFLGKELAEEQKREKQAASEDVELRVNKNN